MVSKKLLKVPLERIPNIVSLGSGVSEHISLEEVVEIQSNPAVGKEVLVSEKLRIEKNCQVKD